MKKFGVSLALAALAAAACWSTPAQAAQSVSMRLSNGTTNTCTVTALAPKMTSTIKKTMSTSATVKCTAAATVTVTIGAVELDGTVEQPQVADRSYRVSVRAGATVTVAGPSFTCVNTEADNEEIATKARVAFSSTVVSPVDRTVPTNNQYAC